MNVTIHILIIDNISSLWHVKIHTPYENSYTWGNSYATMWKFIQHYVKIHLFITIIYFLLDLLPLTFIVYIFTKVILCSKFNLLYYYTNIIFLLKYHLQVPFFYFYYTSILVILIFSSLSVIDLSLKVDSKGNRVLHIWSILGQSSHNDQHWNCKSFQ